MGTCHTFSGTSTRDCRIRALFAKPTVLGGSQMADRRVPSHEELSGFVAVLAALLWIVLGITPGVAAATRAFDNLMMPNC